MKRLFSIILLTFASSSTLAEEPQPKQEAQGEAQHSAQPAEPSGAVVDPDTRCNDTIELVRDAQGQPLFDRGTAFQRGIEPTLAVQQKVEGCDVLVMTNGDFRPLPKLPDDGALYFPAQ